MSIAQLSQLRVARIGRKRYQVRLLRLQRTSQQVAFSVTDEQGKEEIITGEIPYSYDLFRVCQEQGWLNLRRGVSSIRETGRGQRRAMSA